MNRKSFLVGLLAAGCFVATSTLMTSPGNAQADPKVAKAMAILKAETAKLGAPKAEGTDQTADKTTPGLYFGSTKVNNDFTIVDKVKAEAGGTATLFVKSGDDYVRVSTNVPGSVDGRALGTVLDPKGKAIVRWMSPMFRARGKLLGENAERKHDFFLSLTRLAIGG